MSNEKKATDLTAGEAASPQGAKSRKKPKRRTVIISVIVLAALVIGGIAIGVNVSAQNAASKIIKVGASPSPHAEILNQVKNQLASEGYTLEVVEYSDYVQPNVALSEGDLDANYFQHQPYLTNYNQQNGTNLVSAGAIHFEPLSIYAGKSTSLANIPDGAQIAVPSDATNEARALQLLQAQGIITLKDGAGLNATKTDIVSNPHNVTIIESEAASLPRLLQDVNFAVINGNYALSAGLPASSVLASESADSAAAQTYANIIAVRDGDQNSPKTQALVQALQSDTVRNYIKTTYNGTVVPVF